MPPHPSGSAEEASPTRHLADEASLAAAYLRLRRDPLFAGKGVASGRGRQVLVLPGFLTGDETLGVLSRWLKRVGYVPRRAGIRLNVGCGEEMVTRLERRLELVAEQAGGPVAVVGHSRGGHFARVLSVRRPELVSGIVTLGAPPLDPWAINPVVRVCAVAVAALGTIGVPGIMGVSCYLGHCCEDFRADLHAPFPNRVGFVAVYSKRDPVVDWTRLVEPAAEQVEVGAPTHVGLILDRDAFEATGRALDSFDAPSRETISPACM